MNNLLSLYDGSVFSFRFASLRKLYGFKQKEAANLLGYKSQGNIGSLEAGKVRPSFDALIKIHHLYGVSINWLMGISEIPYTEESISMAEKFCDFYMHQLTADMTNNVDIYGFYQYLYNHKETTSFTLDNRFNLVFLCNYIIHNLHTVWGVSPGIVRSIKAFANITDSEDEGIEWEQHMHYVADVSAIWKNPKKPIYDLKEYLKKLSK